MAKGSISPTAGIPFGWFGVAVKLVRPGLGSQAKMHPSKHFQTGVAGEVLLTPQR